MKKKLFKERAAGGDFFHDYSPFLPKMGKKSRAARAHVAAGGRAYPPFTRARTVLGGRDVRHGSLPTAAGPLRRGKGRRGGGIDGGCGEAASCRSVGATARRRARRAATTRGGWWRGWWRRRSSGGGRESRPRGCARRRRRCGSSAAAAARSAAVSIHGRWARGAEQRWPRSAAAVAARARGTLPTRTCSLTVVAAASPRLQ